MSTSKNQLFFSKTSWSNICNRNFRLLRLMFVYMYAILWSKAAKRNILFARALSFMRKKFHFRYDVRNIRNFVGLLFRSVRQLTLCGIVVNSSCLQSTQACGVDQSHCLSLLIQACSTKTTRRKIQWGYALRGGVSILPL